MNDEQKLEFTPKSCWEVYGDATHTAAMDELAERYLAFLTACKTERETVDYVLEKATAAGFSEDAASGKCHRAFRGKTVLLARRGKRPLSEGVRLLGAHGDTPRLDLKQRPLTEEANVGQAKTHYYGGIRKYQWLARPLALHGVVVKTDGEVVRITLGEDPSEPVFTVPDLLPHLARKQNESKLSEAFEGEKLNIIIGHAPDPAAFGGNEGDEKNDCPAKPDKPVKTRVLKLLNQKYGITEEDLYSAELQAVPAGPGRTVGLDGSLLGGYGQDDRVCVFCGLEAILEAEDPEYTQVVIFWDKEEIGSDGNTGAKSMFMEYCLEELIDAWEPGAKLSQVFTNTRAISSDVHAAVDPDFQELHEKLNAATLGYGPCFCKFTGSGGKYMANDAHAEYVGWLRSVLNGAGVPWQMAELGKVDGGGGGTVAKHLAIYGMDIIDCGPAVLSMHSPFELVSKADVYATVKAFTAFLQS